LSRPKLRWGPIVEHAAQLVQGYQIGVTLRQLFYLLLSDGIIPNTDSAYNSLSRKTAQARRDGWFPALIDNTREIHRYQSFNGPHDALVWLTSIYRAHRAETQPYHLVLGAEKSTMLAQLRAWFGDLHLPIVPLRGYTSQTLADDLTDEVQSDPRPSILIYAGDFDASGLDIARDISQRTDGFERVERIAVTIDQIDQVPLQVQQGKPDDARAPRFMREWDLEARFGHRVPPVRDRKGRVYRGLVQVEIEAMPPLDLRNLYQAAIDRYWDATAYQVMLDQEHDDRAQIARLRDGT
jgi:hypothetical protein